jgi:hypothetical protein
MDFIDSGNLTDFVVACVIVTGFWLAVGLAISAGIWLRVGRAAALVIDSAHRRRSYAERLARTCRPLV